MRAARTVEEYHDLFHAAHLPEPILQRVARAGLHHLETQMISSSSLMTTTKVEGATSVKASLWDVVVVGAGPAGAAAATKLGKMVYAS